MNAFVRGVTLLSRACGVFAALCLAAACVIVCQMVVLRYWLGASTIWQTEFVTYAVVASTLIGSPYVLLTRGHVNVDLLPHYLGQTGRMILALIASVLGLAVLSGPGLVRLAVLSRGLGQRAGSRRNRLGAAAVDRPAALAVRHSGY